MDYAKAAASAAATLNKEGLKVPIVRRGRNFDAAGNPTGQITASGTITVIKLSAKNPPLGGFDKVHEPESLRKTSMAYFLASSLDATFPPDLLDEITWEGKKFLLRGVGELNPAGVSILFKIGAVQI